MCVDKGDKEEIDVGYRCNRVSIAVEKQADRRIEDGNNGRSWRRRRETRGGGGGGGGMKNK